MSKKNKFRVRETRSLFVLESNETKPFTVAYFPKYLATTDKKKAKFYSHLVVGLLNNN